MSQSEAASLERSGEPRLHLKPQSTWTLEIRIGPVMSPQLDSPLLHPLLIINPPLLAATLRLIDYPDGVPTIVELVDSEGAVEFTDYGPNPPGVTSDVCPNTPRKGLQMFRQMEMLHVVSLFTLNKHKGGATDRTSMDDR